MKALQRLQQHVLGKSDFPKHLQITPKAARLQQSIKRGLYMTLATSVIVGAATVAGTGMSYDPAALHLGDASNSNLLRNVYDKHRELLAAHEEVKDLKRLMVESDDVSEKSMRELAKDLTAARDKEKALQFDYELLTKDIDPAVIAEVTGDADRVAPAARKPKI